MGFQPLVLPSWSASEHKVSHPTSPQPLTSMIIKWRRFLYMHRVISHHFCAVAFWQRPHSGLAGTLGKNDANLSDGCIRPSTAGATAAPETSTLLSASIRDPSTPP